MNAEEIIENLDKIMASNLDPKTKWAYLQIEDACPLPEVKKKVAEYFGQLAEKEIVNV